MVVSGLGAGITNDGCVAILPFDATRNDGEGVRLRTQSSLVTSTDDGLTRGSRNISKIADMRIDLSRDIKSADPIVRRTMHLMLSKNRFCGRTAVRQETLLFDPET